jgi:hypothetical protein
MRLWVIKTLICARKNVECGIAKMRILIAKREVGICEKYGIKLGNTVATWQKWWLRSAEIWELLGMLLEYQYQTIIIVM